MIERRIIHVLLRITFGSCERSFQNSFIHSNCQIEKKKRCSVKKNSLLNHWYDCSRGKEHWNANFTIVLFCAFLSFAIFRQIKYHHRQSTYDARTILILLMSCSHVFVSLQKEKDWINIKKHQTGLWFFVWEPKLLILNDMMVFQYNFFQWKGDSRKPLSFMMYNGLHFFDTNQYQ